MEEKIKEDREAKPEDGRESAEKEEPGLLESLDSPGCREDGPSQREIKP